jgi:peptide/nickel transport system substrate-binding protein
LVGKVEDLGDRWRISSSSMQRELQKSADTTLLPGTVFEFQLRRGVKWQDGADFDARDVLFSLACFRNPHVDCDEKRFQFDKLARIESDGPYALRLAFAKPYFQRENVFESLTLLPAHLYDLADSRNPDHDSSASAERQARYIAEHPANRMWVGLGPYRVSEWSDTAIVAKRWDGYYDRANGGHVDEIVWRMIEDDGAAMTALMEGELDFYDRMSADDYLGARGQSEAFTRRYYKGHFYAPYISYTAWNMRRAKFADPRVRTALGLCFDWDGFIQSYYKGLAERVTGEQFLRGPAYDPTLEPLGFDLTRARALLGEAGWYDRDQDGVVDRDGTPLEVEFLYPSGNRTSELSGQAFQANLAKVGVKLSMASRDWPAFRARVKARDFDAISMGWITPPVVDPEQAWASKWAGADSANNAGLADDQVDSLIAQIQVELDPTLRRGLFAQLQRRVYELQPYLFLFNVPVRYALRRDLHGFDAFDVDPYYAVRDWYFAAGTPGTRPARGR